MGTEFTTTRESQKCLKKAPVGLDSTSTNRHLSSGEKSEYWCGIVLRPWWGEAHGLRLYGHNPTLNKYSEWERHHWRSFRNSGPALTCIDLPERIYIFALNRKWGKWLDHLSSPSIAAHLLPCVVGWLGIVRLLIGVVAQENGVQFTKRLQICSYFLTYWVAYSFAMDRSGSN